MPSHDQIPANIRAAAEKAGLGPPLWYCGPLDGPNYRRRKTLADIAEEARQNASALSEERTIQSIGDTSLSDDMQIAESEQ